MRVVLVYNKINCNVWAITVLSQTKLNYVTMDIFKIAFLEVHCEKNGILLFSLLFVLL